MAILRAFSSGGIDTYTNPISSEGGRLIRSVNLDSQPYGAKTKRPGYATFLGTPDTSTVKSLFSNYFGTTLYLYRASGSALYYSLQGTGDWTLCSNGTISDGGYFGHAVLGSTLIGGDGVGSTRHTTDGIAFTNTTLAPVGQYFEQYLNRIYIGGTADDLFYSTTNDATNWSTGGTADSSSLKIPGAGKIGSLFKAYDRLITGKTSGLMYRWDGYTLADMATQLGPSSPYSLAEKEGFIFYMNRDGHFGYGGAKPQLLSNAVQSQIYNNTGSAVAGSTFDTMPGVCHRYDYYVSLGTTVDGFTTERIDDCVLKYSYQKNEYLDYSYANFPTAWHSYRDINGNQQLIFGDSAGQCYQIAGTTKTDNGAAISAILEYVVDMKQPETDKMWRWFTGIFNPGCQAKVQVAISDTFRRSGLNWFEVGDCSSGVADFRFPSDKSRGKLLFVRIYESSKDTPFTFYGFSVEAEFEADK